MTIVNLLPVADGGGLQNALSFLETLASARGELDVQVVARAGGAIEAQLEALSMTVHLVSGGRIGRLKFEMSVRKRFPKGSVCFTLFGPPMLGSIGHFVNVNGCAYSNLFYPEVCFWQDYSGRARWKREFIDRARRKFTALADFWIFETEVLSGRAIELCHFPKERVKTVKMAASALVSKELVDTDLAEKYSQRLSSRFKVLFLSGANRNKRVQNLPQIACELQDRGESGVQFVTTLPVESDLFAELSHHFKDSKLASYWVNIGPVPQSEASSLISVCDAMATFSRLESFSNNFVEAWRMGKALIVTDADWSRAACGKGAYYVDPDDAVSVVDTLTELTSSEESLNAMRFAGQQMLDTYPSVKQKNELYIQCIKDAEVLGPCSSSLKRLIKWPSVKKNP